MKIENMDLSAFLFALKGRNKVQQTLELAFLCPYLGMIPPSNHAYSLGSTKHRLALVKRPTSHVGRPVGRSLMTSHAKVGGKSQM